MRIVHIITRLILGGAQENTLYTCEDLMGRGHEVTLVTGPALGPEGELVERARQKGVPLVFVDALRRAINPWRDAASYFALKRILRNAGPHVVHTHSSKAGVLGRKAARAAKVPIVVHTIHGLPFHPYQSALLNRLYVALERKAARASDAVISVADAMTEKALAEGVAPAEKFTTIYSGMEVEPFLDDSDDGSAVRAELGIPPGALVVGKVARLFHLKGHEDLLRAAAKVVEKVPAAYFLLVGSGILEARLRRLAAELGVAERVVFAGLVPPARIPTMIKAMDVLVHASYREGLARALVQALLSARPVVAYDLDGAPEVVLHGRTGYLVRAGDWRTMAERLIELLENENFRRELGRRGREHCRLAFRHEYMSERIEALYLELARKKGLEL